MCDTNRGLFQCIAVLLTAVLAIVILASQSSCGSRSREHPCQVSRATDAEPSFDAGTRGDVLAEVAMTIRNQYADREVGDALADTILTLVAQGRFDSVETADGLVKEVMAVIRNRVSDRHFEFSARLEEEGTAVFPSHARSEHGLRTVRMMEHDTAYLEFDSMPGDSLSLVFVEQALGTLPEPRALIIDIRDNIGGSGDMVVMLCSHLLKPGTLLCRYSGRSDDSPGEMRTTAYRRHFGPDIPVFVLTSGATMSAAEALAYILQDYGRAKLIGEQTAGMANPSRTFLIGERFELTVPFLLMRYGASGGTFAGPGIVPDVATVAELALEVTLAQISD